MLVKLETANSLSLTFWFQPISLIWLVLDNDDSGVSSSRSFTHGHFARWVPDWASSIATFHPRFTD
jgi:hypothetical protein